MTETIDFSTENNISSKMNGKHEINKTKPFLLIILFCTISFPSHLFSQNNYKRKISISEWIEEMEKCKDPVYYLDNTEIIHDEIQDTLYSFTKSRALISGEISDDDKNIIPIVLIKDCKLPNNRTCSVNNLIFHNNITFHSCEGALQFRLINCTFKQGLDIRQSNLYDLEFWNCSILHRVIILELQNSIFYFNNCSFYTDDKVVESIYFFGTEKENQSYQYLFDIRQNEKKINKFYLDHCKFLPTKVKPVISFRGGKYDAIGFEGINFSNSIVDFTNCSVKENFTIQECKFNQPIGTTKFNFPKDNTSFNWSQLDSVGLGLYSYYEVPPYTHNTDSLISDVNNFNDLNSSYRKFYTMY